MKINTKLTIVVVVVAIVGAAFYWRMNVGVAPDLDLDRGTNTGASAGRSSSNQQRQLEAPVEEQNLGATGSSVLKLERIAVVPATRMDSPLFIGKRVIDLPGGQKVTLPIQDGLNSLRVRPNSDFTRFLVSEGAPRKWSVYDAQGDLVVKLPSVAEVLPGLEDLASIQWTWFHENSLLAIAEIYPKSDPSVPKYPEEDPVPLEVRLYRYGIDSGATSRLILPEDGVPRLEGVSDDGALIVSFVDANGDYWGPRAQGSIRAFRISDAH